MAIELVCELALADGTERFSLAGVTGETKFYEPRILRFGDFSVDVPEIPGDARMSGTSVALDDADRRFSKSKSDNVYKNVSFRWLAGDFSLGESSITEVFCGRVDNYSGGRGVFELKISQTSFPKFSRSLTGKMNRIIFPDIEDETSLRLVPWLTGEITSERVSNVGAVPAYRIDPAVSQSKYRYVAAQGAIQLIKNTYTYGVKTTSGVTGTTATYDGVTYSVIDYDADPLTATRRNENEVSWDGTGTTDDASATGDDITNPARQFEAFLLNNGFVSGDLNSASFTEAEARFAERGIVGGVCIVGDGSETVREVVETFTNSFNMYVYPAQDGKLAISASESPPSDTSGLQTLKQHEIALGSFSFKGTRSYASKIAYGFQKNHVSGVYEDSSSFEQAAQTSKLGEVIEAKPLELDYVRLNSVASLISQDRLFFMAEQRQIVEVLVDPSRYADFKVGDQILFSHNDGISTGDGGYDAVAFQVIGFGFSFVGEGVALLSLKLVDLIAADFSPEGFDHQFETVLHTNVRTGTPQALPGMTRVPQRFNAA